MHNLGLHRRRAVIKHDRNKTYIPSRLSKSAIRYAKHISPLFHLCDDFPWGCCAAGIDVRSTQIACSPVSPHNNWNLWSIKWRLGCVLFQNRRAIPALSRKMAHLRIIYRPIEVALICVFDVQIYLYINHRDVAYIYSNANNYINIEITINYGARSRYRVRIRIYLFLISAADVILGARIEKVQRHAY